VIFGLSYLPGCAEPIQAPSAFDGERYLCDAENVIEFDALLDNCRGLSEPCAGYTSVRGLIDSQLVIVDGPVSRATYIDLPPTDREVGRALTLRTRAPYFELVFELRRFGIPPERSRSGPVCGLNAEAACDLTGPAGGSATQFVDLEARGANFLSILTSQVREIQLETADELRFAITADLARGGHVEACFDVFPQLPEP
jgi:hypothetical protein